MQQKVIEKPNIDAHYNAAQYKYLRSFAVKFGPEIVNMVGWDDKTGVDVGEPEQPTAATQHTGKSWVHTESPVGEGQHSFHKTNLTPSVRLVHEIGSSIEESFYRGLPQLIIKDAIFQPSSSARHATEVFQMLQANPQLMKPVQIFTNDGGSDHTIRHERNIVAMLALFLRLPEVVFLINFQMAAYRSAYHPVEKLNCILNLAWNGVGLSREAFEDPILENVFGQCSSMSDVRMKSERHPGIRTSLEKSLAPSIKILDERAKQASLKENSFETFRPASDEEIKDFLNVIQVIDPEFDVDRFLDKKKPYHFSPLLKAYLEKHLVSTHYSLTFMRQDSMSKEFLNENYPAKVWSDDLVPVPCPVVDKENPEKYLSYDKVSSLAVKDYSDSCRPGAIAKTPSNIPFTKSKQRALNGASLAITCETCNKSRVVYIERKPSSVEIKAAKAALLNVRYMCGGRVSSFGRSLAVLEEIADITVTTPEISDEIEVESLGEIEPGAFTSPDTDIIDEFDVSWEEEPKIKRKKMIIESDESDEEPMLDLLASPEQSMTVNEDPLETPDHESNPPCSFCGNFATSHKCRKCRAACCNICNTEHVEELGDIVCPYCQTPPEQFEKVELQLKKRGRPRKQITTGAILIPLAKQNKGRPRKLKNTVEPEEDQEDANNNTIDGNVDDENESETEVEQSSLVELRILGSGNTLKKLFVDESLTCESPIESHTFDLLLAFKKPLPCSYCGEAEEAMLFSKLTVESFPLCRSCREKGRGAGVRRKSRRILPKPVKKIKPKVSLKKKTTRQPLIT